MPKSLEQEFEGDHVRKILQHNKHVERVLINATKTIASDIARHKLRYPAGGSVKYFQFNRALEKQIDRALATVHNDVTVLIEDAIVDQWELANLKNDGLVKGVVKGAVVPDLIMKSFHQVNVGAMNAFMNRSDDGMNLSTRVWNLVGDNKKQLELYLASGITTGRSAAKISQDIRLLLKEPKRLFRRVRDDKGRLILSGAARAYNPGAGAYRSSYKNALRLAATETNMAYRLSDFERRQQLPFVLGIEVHLSGAHPQLDICDSMIGRYPPGFKFVGWHPWCLCYTTSVTMSPDQFKQYLKTGNADQRLYLRSIPGSATRYLAQHNQQIRRWKHRPYWHRDNFTRGGDVKETVFSKPSHAEGA